MRRALALLAAVLAVAAVSACGDDDQTTTGLTGSVSEPATEPATSAPASEPSTEDSTEASVPGSEPTDAAEASDSTGTASEPTETQAGEESSVAVYLVQGEKVSPVRRAIPGQPLARSALQALLEGPTADDGERTTAVPDGTQLLDVAIDDGGILTVDLSGEFASGGGSLSIMLRAAQVVYTAFQFPTVKGVTFRLDGQPITTLGGEGLVVDRPQTPADFEDVTPAVLVQEPLPGDAVSCPVKVHGTSNVFEATSLLGLTSTEQGLPQDPTVVTATSGTGTRGTFDVQVECTPPPPGPVFLVSWWASAKDGSAQDVEYIPLSFR